MSKLLGIAYGGCPGSSGAHQDGSGERQSADGDAQRVNGRILPKRPGTWELGQK
jgi:hypothetical protein